MRILHIGKFFPPVPGGMERFLDDLSHAQSEQGIASTILVHDPQRSGIETSAGRTLMRARSYADLLFVPLSPTWPFMLGTALRRARPDLIHIHMPNPWAYGLLLSSRARRIPWLVHWHADIPLDAQHRALRLAYPLYAIPERWLLRRVARVVVTSQAYLDHSAALAGVRERCEVVPLGMPDAASAKPDAVVWPGAGMKLLAVGRLSYYKGFPILLDALARTPDVSLLLVGNGDQTAALRAQAERLGIGERVRFAGRLDDAVIAAAYRDCDALCLPSIDRSEAFGLVLLEAMRAGKPLLASRLRGSGMSEVVEHEVNGLQFATGDVDDLARQLARLRDDPSLRKELGTRGRTLFELRYRIEPVAARITNIYRELLA